MSYCTKCGNEIKDGDKYCSNCGSSISQDTLTQRTTEYAGKVIKCPACGEVIPSFTAICPSCGHEITSGSVSDSLESFSSKIEELEVLIEGESHSRKDIFHWTADKGIIWFILNCFTLFVPELISIILYQSGFSKKPKLSYGERKKTIAIENFEFPYNRKSILEGLSYIKGKLSYLNSKKIDPSLMYWANLWFEKSNQLYKHAEILFPGDSIARSTYSEINNLYVSIRKRIKKRLYILLLICLVLVALLVSLYFGLFREKTEILTWPEEYTDIIPAPNENSYYITEHDDKQFSFKITGDLQQYKNYLRECEKMGFYYVVTETLEKPYKYISRNIDGYEVEVEYDGYHSINVDIIKGESLSKTLSGNSFDSVDFNGYVFNVPSYWILEEEDFVSRHYSFKDTSNGINIQMILTFMENTPEFRDISISEFAELFMQSVEYDYENCTNSPLESFTTEIGLSGIMFDSVYPYVDAAGEDCNIKHTYFIISAEESDGLFIVAYCQKRNHYITQYLDDCYEMVTSVQSK